MEKATGRWTAALVVLCGACLSLEFRHIAATLPYPQNIDEPALANPAIRMLTTGTLHPYEYNYPSLAKYLTAVGMAIGFLRSAGQLGVHEVAKIGCVGFPFYNVPEVMQGARQLFALCSIVALGATGAAAFYAFRRPATILLAPLALALCPMFFRDAWSYLNVDIVGLCFVALTSAFCMAATHRPSLVRSALLPGACAGLAAGSKYTLAVAILPVLLAIALFGPTGRRIVASGLAFVAMVAAFLFVMPYAVLDIPGTLNGLAFDAFHYASGHAGVEVEPGLPQVLAYTRDMVAEFGLVGLILAEVGACACLVWDPRRTLVLAAFPLALLRMLVVARVHFERNALAVFGIGAMFAAYGLVRSFDWISALILRRGWPARRALPGVGIALVLVALPFWRLRDWTSDRTDSRTLAAHWVALHLPTTSTVLVPEELHVAPSRDGRVRAVELGKMTDAAQLRRLLKSAGTPAVVLVPHWGADPRFPGQERADALNSAAVGLQVLASFGSNPVLVNYPEPAPAGDPQFSIAALRRVGAGKNR